MKTLVILFVFVGGLLTGCASHHPQSLPAPETARAAVPVTTMREMVLLYLGAQNPGAVWEQKSTSFGTRGWELRLSVNLRMSMAEGKKAYSLLLTELGTLPAGETWIGPVHPGSHIERGATIGNMPTSTGLMIMLLIDPRKEVLRWWEP